MSDKKYCIDCLHFKGRRNFTCAKIISYREYATEDYIEKTTTIIPINAEPRIDNKENSCKYYEEYFILKWFKKLIRKK